MGRKKAKNRVSKFKYYSVIVSRIIEMIFVFTICFAICSRVTFSVRVLPKIIFCPLSWT